ncbi:hypothetical protein CXB51_025487 [Gossypium anomalum]|uniref:Clathrin/coatomer adaptor adaptin-like N-terminal domain-containing protein n=1 Tax=Gossypium anomalum TaxID=47600 RepID=A0A8J5YAG7_9ROSI|nr:hypothetical protein CXB51_025487 [Gossypium anomalum]
MDFISYGLKAFFLTRPYGWDMIRAIRSCKTAAEERAVVRKECAAIRASISENDQDYRTVTLQSSCSFTCLDIQLIWPNGVPEVRLRLSSGFPEKRIGYLGLMLLLDERQEVLMLVTNSLKQDLNHSNQYIIGLALCALGNICSAEMARDLAPEVEGLLQFRDPNIRKKVKRVAAGLLHSACIDGIAETGSLFVFGDKVVANLVSSKPVSFNIT